MIVEGISTPEVVVIDKKCIPRLARHLVQFSSPYENNFERHLSHNCTRMTIFVIFIRWTLRIIDNNSGDAIDFPPEFIMTRTPNGVGLCLYVMAIDLFSFEHIIVEWMLNLWVQLRQTFNPMKPFKSHLSITHIACSMGKSNRWLTHTLNNADRSVGDIKMLCRRELW